MVDAGTPRSDPTICVRVPARKNDLPILARREPERLNLGAVGISKRRERSSLAIRTNRFWVREVADGRAGIQPEDRTDFCADEDHLAAAFWTGGER